jgi:sugar lactone lactonase YvrE
MDNQEKEPTGSFYCFAGGRVVPAGKGGISITNGPAVAPDGRTLYHVDTLGQTIEACDIGDDGALGPSRHFVRIGAGEGYPDGPTIDSEGCLWIGLYGGWEARRYSPQGELLGRVRFPVANVTKLAFGGDDLRTVYATTARQFLSEAELERQPMAGHLFQFRADVPGLPSHEVAL